MTAPDIRAAVERDYPCSQDEAKIADRWRFHKGSICPADCDEIYYRRKGWPNEALGPTPPHLIRWTDTADASDILAWHPVYSASQRRRHATDRERLERELAEAREERDEALCAAEGPSTLRELASCSIANVHARHEAEQRALAAEARCKEMEEALELIQEEASIANNVIRLGRYSSGGGRVKIGTALHRIERLSALTGSTGSAG